MASCSKAKIPRLEDYSDVHTIKLPKTLRAALATALNGLLYRPQFAVHEPGNYITLTPLKILESNASAISGKLFSKAYCDVRRINQRIMFSDVFQGGVYMLKEYLAHKKLPESKRGKVVLSKLLRYLLTSTETQHAFQNIERLSETHLTTVLANHLFGQIATSPNYIIDKNCSGKKKNNCLCGDPCCILTGSFGDTSIGNGGVWHGNLDIIINDELAIEPLDEKQDCPGGKSPVEVKLKSDVLSHNQQILAETVVFSFLQKQRHPERENFLTPCIGIGNTDLVVVLYDSEKDFLFESSRVSLFNEDPDENSPKTLNITAVLVAWMTVNYKYLCTGITKEIEKSECKADFFARAKEKLEVYNHQLKFQHVGVSTSEEKATGVDLGPVHRSIFLLDAHKEMVDYIYHVENIDSNDSS